MSIPGEANMGCWAMTFSRKHLSCQAAPIGKRTWASLETYAMIAADGTITLHTSSAFDGAVLLIG